MSRTLCYNPAFVDPGFVTPGKSKDPFLPISLMGLRKLLDHTDYVLLDNNHIVKKFVLDNGLLCPSKQGSKNKWVIASCKIANSKEGKKLNLSTLFLKANHASVLKKVMIFMKGDLFLKNLKSLQTSFTGCHVCQHFETCDDKKEIILEDHKGEKLIFIASHDGIIDPELMQKFVSEGHMLVRHSSEDHAHYRIISFNKIMVWNKFEVPILFGHILTKAQIQLEVLSKATAFAKNSHKIPHDPLHLQVDPQSMVFAIHEARKIMTKIYKRKKSFDFCMDFLTLASICAEMKWGVRFLGKSLIQKRFRKDKMSRFIRYDMRSLCTNHLFAIAKKELMTYGILPHFKMTLMNYVKMAKFDEPALPPFTKHDHIVNSPVLPICAYNVKNISKTDLNDIFDTELEGIIDALANRKYVNLLSFSDAILSKITSCGDKQEDIEMSETLKALDSDAPEVVYVEDFNDDETEEFRKKIESELSDDHFIEASAKQAADKSEFGEYVERGVSAILDFDEDDPK